MSADDTSREALIERVAEALADYRKVFPEPHSLAPNLALAVEAAGYLKRDRLRNAGECWDQAPEIMLATAERHECVPPPSLCHLRAGHLGAHTDGRAQWSHGEPALDLDAAIKRAEAAEAERDLLEAERDQALAELGRRK